MGRARTVSFGRDGSDSTRTRCGHCWLPYNRFMPIGSISDVFATLKSEPDTRTRAFTGAALLSTLIAALLNQFGGLQLPFAALWIIGAVTMIGVTIQMLRFHARRLEASSRDHLFTVLVTIALVCWGGFLFNRSFSNLPTVTPSGSAFRTASYEIDDGRCAVRFNSEATKFYSVEVCRRQDNMFQGSFLGGVLIASSVSYSWSLLTRLKRLESIRF